MKNVTLGIVLSAAAFSANAQNNPAVTQADAARQQREARDVAGSLGPGDTVPALYAEEDLDVGPQAILRQRKQHWIRGSVDAQAYYTDNMFFQNDRDIFGRRVDRIDAGVAVTTAEVAAMTPPCITRWASYRAEVGYRHQFFNYFGEDEPIVPGTRLDREDFDFESSTVFADVLAQTAHYQFRAGFDYTRLLGFEPLRSHDYEDFYTEYVPRWSVQRNFRVCDRSQFSIAYLGSYHFTEEDPVLMFTGTGFRRGFEDRNERWEHAALAAYSVALPCNFVVQPYYRFQFTDYANFDVSESLHTAGLGLGWYPCENFSARLFANYNWNDADGQGRDYEQLNVGGGVNFTLRF